MVHDVFWPQVWQHEREESCGQPRYHSNYDIPHKQQLRTGNLIQVEPITVPLRSDISTQKGKGSLIPWDHMLQTCTFC